MNAGKQAEEQAAIYLDQRGFNVIQMNWKTPACEIDIVASKKRRQSWYSPPAEEIYFVEVKYRRNDSQGKPLEYVTKKKLDHMSRAAHIWTQQHEWSGQIHLSAIGVRGEDFEIEEFIEDIIL